MVYNGITGQIEQTKSLPSTEHNYLWVHIAVANLRGNGDKDVILQSLNIVATSGNKTHAFYVKRDLLAWDMENNKEILRINSDEDLTNGYYAG